MQSKNWKQVKELLNHVLPLDPAERISYLNNSAVKPEILLEVESLLAFEEASEDLMNLSAVEFSKDFFDEGENALIGQQIGVYKIVRELGFGGMGAVYLADRTDGKFEQKVALKLLKREMNTAALRRRFQQEREILASLEHPHIARLLDAGTTADKIPFLAMEYVEGLPIDDYCNRHQLDLNQRLDLFRKVCSAVNFAHRNLIVHRDLKPSNILVNQEGTPKLLDFGISKILSAELEQLDSATVTKLGVMTPGYASPEQLQSKSVTTATDIYSLGIILYELLSGHRPFENKESDFKEIYKAVLETEPVPPSNAISDFKFQIPDSRFQKIPDSRFQIPDSKPDSKPDSESKTVILSEKTKNQRIYTNPQSAIPNPKSVSGDLDNIVLKALRKEPERRYSSAENLAEDIHRHQRGLPVTARPNTFSYRAEKFIKRNRASVFAGVLILFVLVGGIAATLWQARVARAERVKAENRFNDVRTLANSFLFEFSPLIENLPGSTPARELLVKRAVEYLDNLSQEAGDNTELQRELAKAYEKVGDVQGNPLNPNIGDVKGAIESYEKARTIRRRLLDKNADNIQAMSDLANSYKLVAGLHTNGGDFSKAEEFYAQALILQEKVIEQNPNDFNARSNRAEILKQSGYINYVEERHKKAIEFYHRAREIFEQLMREQPENYQIAAEHAYMFTSIGEAQGWDNDLASASVSLQKGLDLLIPICEKYPNDRALQRSLMVSYNKRGENYEDVENYEKAVEVYSKGLEIAQNALKSDPKDFQSKRDVAMDNERLAGALNSIGKSRESLEKMFVSINMHKELAAADPNNTEALYDIANTRLSISDTYWTLKDYDAVLETCEKAQSEFQAALEKNPKKSYLKRGLVFIYRNIGRSYAALAEKNNRPELLQKSLANFRTALHDLNALKNEGKLSEYDLNEITKLEKELEKVGSKIKN